MRTRFSIFALLAMSGCLGQPRTPGDPEVHLSGPKESRFPSADALKKLGDSSAPKSVARADVLEAEQWDLVDPPRQPDGSSAHTPSTPWERLLGDLAAGRSGLLFASEAMHCTARQIGQFYLAKHAMPDETVVRFMAGRCGA